MKETLQPTTSDLDAVAARAGLGRHVVPGRAWTDGVGTIAVVAVVNVFAIDQAPVPYGAIVRGDWTARIGWVPWTNASNANLMNVARHGAVLSEHDARHYFTCTALEYRPS